MSETNKPLSSLPTVTKVEATGLVTTTSATPALITGMTITPPAGNYLAKFSCQADDEDDEQVSTFAIYKDAVIANASNARDTLTDTAHDRDNIDVMTTQDTVSVNGSEAINVRFSTTGGFTLNVTNRSLIIMKIL